MLLQYVKILDNYLNVNIILIDRFASKPHQSILLNKCSGEKCKTDFFNTLLC